MTDKTMGQRLQELATRSPLGATVAMKLTDGETWYVESDASGAKATTEALPNVATTFTLSTADLAEMLDKKLNPTQAFMSGRMQIEGDMAVAMKLAQLMA